MPHYTIVGLLVLSLAAGAGAQEGKGPSKEALDRGWKQLNGTWKLVASVRDGKPAALPTEDVLVIVRDGKYTVRVGGKVTDEGTDTIDPTTTPMRIDSKPAKRKGQLGIYEITGDDLRVCFGPVGGPRPTAFESRPGSGDSLGTYRRIAK